MTTVSSYCLKTRTMWRLKHSLIQSNILPIFLAQNLTPLRIFIPFPFSHLTSTTCNFLSFVPYPATNFKSIPHLACQKLWNFQRGGDLEKNPFWIFSGATHFHLCKLPIRILFNSLLWNLLNIGCSTLLTVRFCP